MEFEKSTNGARCDCKKYSNNLDMLEVALNSDTNFYDAEQYKLFIGELIEIKGIYPGNSKIFSKNYPLSEKEEYPKFFVGFDKGEIVRGCFLCEKPIFYLDLGEQDVRILKRDEEMPISDKRIRKNLTKLVNHPLVPSDRKARKRNK